MSIMPGMENLAPERHETKSGLLGSPKVLPTLFLDGVHGSNFLVPHALREFVVGGQVGVACPRWRR